LYVAAFNKSEIKGKSNYKPFDQHSIEEKCLMT